MLPLALATAANVHSLVELTEGFGQSCLTAGIESLTRLMNEDVARLAGERHGHCPDTPGCRRGHSRAQVGFHGGRIDVDRPRGAQQDHRRCRCRAGRGAAGGYPDQWAKNPMVMNVATRKFRRAVRLPESDVAAEAGSGLPKSTGSRRFKALTQAKFDGWTGSDLPEPDLVAIRIDGRHPDDRLLMTGAVGIEVSGQEHPPGIVEGATGNAATVQALPGNLIGRGLDPEGCRLFTVVGLGLPLELRRSLASTNIIASMNRSIRQVHRNVKRWRDARMALRWTVAGMFEAGKGFRRIKACRQLPILRQVLIKHRQKNQLDRIKGAA